MYSRTTLFATILAVLSTDSIQANKYRIDVHNETIIQDGHVLSFKQEIIGKNISFEFKLFRVVDRFLIRVELGIRSNNNPNSDDVYSDYMNTTFEGCDALGHDTKPTVLSFLLKQLIKSRDFIKMPISCPIKAVKFFLYCRCN